MESEKKVADDFYPPLYHAADKKSRRGQKRYKLLFRIELLILILAALVSILPVLDTESKRLAALLLAILFAAELGIRSYIHLSKVQDDWYYGRAIAESIKTMTWKFAMCPYIGNSEAEKEKENQQFAEQIIPVLGVWENEGTKLMETRGSNFVSTHLKEMKSITDWKAKRTFYHRGRIMNQRNWYAAKSARNSALGNRYFYLTIICYALALVLSINYILYPEQLNVVPLITVIASSILGWTQLNHFKDLKNAYAVAREEIDDIIVQLEKTIEGNFYRTVENTENAFSREHTVWLARKDANAITRTL